MSPNEFEASRPPRIGNSREDKQTSGAHPRFPTQSSRWSPHSPVTRIVFNLIIGVGPACIPRPPPLPFFLAMPIRRYLRVYSFFDK
ncbi:hypothetical protein CRG98_035311 [Punica granatum]|uniref:Uncharacterized protein n=1 Tax=Punica granatum TaxID=22663 RepID=A0A2I0IJQ5_PUNGR|nr:hypothetical protein CRG98_035311 [Punica granatum]